MQRPKIKDHVIVDAAGIGGWTTLLLGAVSLSTRGWDEKSAEAMVGQGNELKEMLKTITRKTTPMSFDERIQKLNEVQQGWANNFRIANNLAKLKDVNGWIRNQLRYCFWHHWKKPEKKRRSLIRLGVEPGKAYAYSRSRMGGWAIAQSPILVTTITVERLKKRGYNPMLDIYKRISPQLNEPLYTRTVRTVV